jgi:DNA polymerase
MNQVDIKQALKQHLEIESFISGGVTVKSKTALPKTAQKEKKITADNQKQKQLEEIAVRVSQCTNCALSKTRNKTVPGEGNPDADIVFIGEGPGGDEDKQGRPFVGRAGKLLDKIIQAMGLDRSDVFIGNIIKCRPPNNRDPKMEEISQCHPFLQQQLEIIDPKIIVALGSPAAKTLLDTTEGIGKLRGRFHEYVPGFGKKPIKLMPTYHPAYLLRNYTKDSRGKVWEDMKKVMQELNLPIQ